MQRFKDYGDYIDIASFKEAISEHSFIDYDGYGYLELENGLCIETPFYPSMIDMLPEGVKGIWWFNR